MREAEHGSRLQGVEATGQGRVSRGEPSDHEEGGDPGCGGEKRPWRRGPARRFVQHIEVLLVVRAGASPEAVARVAGRKAGEKERTYDDGAAVRRQNLEPGTTASQATVVQLAEP